MELGHGLAIMVLCCWGGGRWAPSQDWREPTPRRRERPGMVSSLPGPNSCLSMLPLVPSWGGERQGGKLGEHQCSYAPTWRCLSDQGQVSRPSISWLTKG